MIVTRRLSHLADIRVSNVDKLKNKDEAPVRLCNYVDVYKNECVHPDLDLMEASASESEIARFRLLPGDTVFTKDSETADDIGVPAIVTGTADDFVCGYHLAIARPRPGVVDPKYLFWWLRSSKAAGLWEVRASGVTRVGLRQADIGKLPLDIVEDVREQRAITDLLDRETAQIDATVDAQQRLVGLLHERLDSVWSDRFMALTETSRSLPLRRVISSIVDGPFGSSLTSAHYAEDDSGVRVIRLGNIGVNTFKNDDKAYIPLEYARQLAAHEAAAGDVIVAGLGDERMPLGRAAVLPDIGPAIVKADCYRVRPSSAVQAEYLAWALSAPPAREQMALLSRGSTRQRLNTSVVQGVSIPIPEIADQTHATGAFSESSVRIDAMIANAEKSIALLRERRAALITAAVTGRLDPRTAVERLDDMIEGEAS